MGICHFDDPQFTENGLAPILREATLRLGILSVKLDLSACLMHLMPGIEHRNLAAVGLVDFVIQVS